MSRGVRLADYICSTRFSLLPESVVHACKRLTMDYLGVTVGAANEDPSRVIQAYVATQARGGEATILGTRLSAPPALAALANGLMSAQLEQDDVHRLGSHASSVYAPALLAVAEDIGASGQNWITALALAYDVGIGVNQAFGLAEQYERGFHPTSVSGSFGAVAGAARLRELPAERVVNAIGLNSVQVSGTLSWELEPEHFVKSFQSGMAARNAVTAVDLAALGYVGPPDVFDDGKHTMFGVFTSRESPEQFCPGLGEEFAILDTTFKFYSCCRAIHTALDIVFDLRSQYAFEAEDVERLSVSLCPDITPIVDGNVLTTHNLQFVLAVALLDGEITPRQTSVVRRTEAGANELAKRVSLTPDPGLHQRFPESGIIGPTRVELLLRDGREWVLERETARGSPGLPASDADIEEKFLRFAERSIRPSTAREVVDLVWHLDSLDHIDRITHLLRTP